MFATRVSATSWRDGRLEGSAVGCSNCSGRGCTRASWRHSTMALVVTISPGRPVGWRCVTTDSTPPAKSRNVAASIMASSSASRVTTPLSSG
jgi:hypothetical protein